MLLHCTQKHIDAFASAFGFFVVGCDLITYYSIGYPVHRKFYNVQQPLLWFFKVRGSEYLKWVGDLKYVSLVLTHTYDPCVK